MNLTVGQKAARSLTLTSQHVQTFTELSDDYNPVESSSLYRLGDETVLEGEAWCCTFSGEYLEAEKFKDAVVIT